MFGRFRIVITGAGGRDQAREEGAIRPDRHQIRRRLWIADGATWVVLSTHPADGPRLAALREAVAALPGG